MFNFKNHLHKKIVFGIENRSSSSSSLSKERSVSRFSPLSLTKNQVSIKMDSSVVKLEESPSNNNSSGNKQTNKKINPFELR